MSSADILGQIMEKPAEFAPSTRGTTDEEKAASLVDAFLSRLLVDASVETRLLNIAVESADPVLAAKAANAVARRRWAGVA